MRKASISETKNHLSKLLEEVKSGTTILILDRNRPVARLEPVASDRETNADRFAQLVRQGLVTGPKCVLDLESFLAADAPGLPAGVSSIRTLLDERASGR